MAAPRICSIPACGKKHYSRGYCRPHYGRFMDHGDPFAGRRPVWTALNWILDHVRHQSDDCLIWPFYRNLNGYARIDTLEIGQGAHRLMCELVHGLAPTDRHETAHSCGRGHEACVNPRHLRWATPKENSADRERHGTVNRGRRNGSAKLSNDQVMSIFAMKGRRSSNKVAREFGISDSSVLAIWKGRKWSWLTRRAA